MYFDPIPHFDMQMVYSFIYHGCFSCHFIGLDNIQNRAALWAIKFDFVENRDIPISHTYKKTKNHHDADFFITGGALGCHNDKIHCHQQQQSRHHDNSQFSVYIKDHINELM